MEMLAHARMQCVPGPFSLLPSKKGPWYEAMYSYTRRHRVCDVAQLLMAAYAKFIIKSVA